MLKKIAYFMTFVLMMTFFINFYVYATEVPSEMTTEIPVGTTEEQASDDIQEEDMYFQAENTINEKIVNKYFICVCIVFLASLIIIIYKIGFGKNSFIVVLGVILSFAIMYLFGKILSIFSSMNFLYVAVATIGIAFYISYEIVDNLEKTKNKTEDVSFKEGFIKALIVEKNLILMLTNVVVISYVGLGMFYRNSKIVTKEMVVVAALGVIEMIISGFITSVLYIIFNRKKTLYRTTSENKLDGNRSLKI